MALKSKDLLAIQDLDERELRVILDNAANLKTIAARPVKKVPALRGRTVANLFYEPSTRTRISFELAARRLSADFINISAATTAAGGGETLTDTAKTVEAMQVDFLVVRHSMAGAAHQLARQVRCSVINAGDGHHEHPTQTLADLFTVWEYKKRVAGLKIAILGDHPRTAATISNIYGFKKMGADVTLVGPSTLIPPLIGQLGVAVSNRIDEGVAGADVILLSRVEITDANRLQIPSLREYSRFFCLTAKRLALAAPDCLVLHSGSMNRGVEISPEVAEAAFPRIVQQVTNGIAVRMAVLYLLAGSISESTY